MEEMIITEACHKTGTSFYDMHYHNDYEIIYVHKGEAEITVNDKVHHVSGGNLVFISNLENHEVKILKEPYDRYFVTLNPKLTDRKISSTDLLFILKSRPKGFLHCVDISSVEYKVEYIFKTFIGEYNSPSPFSNEYAIAALSALLIEAYRCNNALLSVPDTKIKYTILEIQKYLDEHYMHHIKIEDVCKKYYIDRYYLSHAFKTYTGYSPKQYLTSTRLKNACSLLDAGQSTTSTAFSCGFYDQNNFIRCFKREYNLLPSQYRDRRTLQDKSER